MDGDDLADIIASFRRSPPLNTALAQIKRVLMVGLQVVPKDGSDAPDASAGASPDENTAAWSPEQFEQYAAMLNGRMRACAGATP